MTDMDEMAREMLCSHCDTDSEDHYDEMPVTAAEAESAIRAALLTAPPGWKLVPVELTPEMETANVMYGDTSDWWNAVITAAPEPK